MSLITTIGVVASLFTATSLLPQLIKILKEKEVEGFSFITLAVLSIGLCLWISYGILKQDWILIISNGFSFFVNLIIGVLGIKYKKA